MNILKKYAFYGSAVVAAFAIALVMLVSSTPRTAHASNVTMGPMTNTGVVAAQTSTYTFNALGTATTALTSVTVTFPTNYNVGTAPAVTVTAGGAACGATAAGAAGTVTITTTGLCNSAGSLVVTITVTNPTVVQAYTIGAQAATVGFQLATSLDTTAVSATSGAPTITAAVVAASFAGTSMVTGAVTPWTTTFTASSAGALVAGNVVTIVLPSGFIIPAAPTVTLGGAFAANVATAATTGQSVAVTLGAGSTLAANGVGTVALAGITNPSAGPYAAAGFTVKTTPDVTARPAAAIVTILGTGSNNLTLFMTNAGLCSATGTIATAVGNTIVAPTAKADGSDTYSMCVNLTDGSGNPIANAAVTITTSIGFLATGTIKVQLVITGVGGVGTTNYRGAGNVATTDTAVASYSTTNTVANPLSIALTAPSGTTASKLVINAPAVLAVAATVTNTSPQYGSPTTATNISLQTTDAAGLGVGSQQVQLTVDKGGLVGNVGFAATTPAALAALCTTTPARSIIVGTTLATNSISVGGTITAGTADFVYCTNQTDAVGKATITANNVTTTMAPATLAVTAAGRPAKITTTQTGSQITATVTDSAGNVVADNTPVVFTISSNVGAVSTGTTAQCTTNGVATAQVALTGSTGAVIVSASWNESSTAATCLTAAGSQTVAQTVLVSAGGAVTPGTPTTPGGGTGSFAATPIFSSSKLANAVFSGSVAQLDTALTASGGTGAWAQDSKGVFMLYVVNGGFVNDGFKAAFPQGFTVATALTLVGK